MKVDDYILMHCEQYKYRIKELEKLSRLKSEDFNIVTSTCLPDNAVFMATEDIRTIGYLHGPIEYKIVGLVVIKNVGLDSE